MGFLNGLLQPRRLSIFTDGAIRLDQGKSGMAAVVYDSRGQVLHWWARQGSRMTNNEAEYGAVILAMEALHAFNPDQVAIYTDSQIVVEQMNGRARVNSPSLKPLHAQLLSMVIRFPRVAFQHIPREQNRLADALANDAAEGNVHTLKTHKIS
jgi:ribonuclease HI